MKKIDNIKEKIADSIDDILTNYLGSDLAANLPNIIADNILSIVIGEIEEKCVWCMGLGHIDYPFDRCHKCKGTGKIEIKHPITIKDAIERRVKK